MPGKRKLRQAKRGSPQRSMRPTGRGRNARGPKSNPQNGIQTIGAAIGHIAPRAWIKRGGVAQQLTDQDPEGSERISGCDLFTQPVQSGSTTAAAGFGGTGTYWQSLTPGNISSRLAAIEEMFQWYIIREIKIMYSPATGSNTVGSVAIGVSTDSQARSAFTTPTQQQIMELQPALLTPVWGMASMTLKARGTKLFESYASGEALDEKVQASIAAVILGGTASTVYGQLWLEYTIDFYQQIPLLSSVDLFKDQKPCPRCHQYVLEDPRLRKQMAPRERKDQPDRDDGFVVLRTSEPQQGSATSPTYQGLERPALRREETKAQSSMRSASLKG